MLKTPLIAALALFTVAQGVVRAADLPKAIQAQIPHGYGVMLYKAGRINDDGRPGYLVVIHHPDDSREKPSPRPLLIFIPSADGAFKLAARNNDVVMQADQGGQCDPFDDGDDGLAIKDRYFTVQNSVACGDHWSVYITFHYDTQRRDWLFHKAVEHSFDPLNNDSGTSSVKAADKSHPVSFSAWIPAP